MTEQVKPATWDNSTICFGDGCPNCETEIRVLRAENAALRADRDVADEEMMRLAERAEKAEERVRSLLLRHNAAHYATHGNGSEFCDDCIEARAIIESGRRND